MECVKNDEIVTSEGKIEEIKKLKLEGKVICNVFYMITVYV